MHILMERKKKSMNYYNLYQKQIAQVNFVEKIFDT